MEIGDMLSHECTNHVPGVNIQNFLVKRNSWTNQFRSGLKRKFWTNSSLNAFLQKEIRTKWILFRSKCSLLTFSFFRKFWTKWILFRTCTFLFKQDRNSEQNQFCSVFFSQRTRRIGRAQKWRRCWQKTVSRNSVNRSELAQTYAKLFSTSYWKRGSPISLLNLLQIKTKGFQ